MNSILRWGCNAFVLGGLAASPASADETWTVEAGAARVAVSGIRTYALPAYKMRENLTPHVNSAFVRVARTLGPRWSVGVGYAGYETLRAAGASSDGDIFDRDQIAFQAVVPLEFSDRIEEYMLDARWHWPVTPRLGLTVGPVLSWFQSTADLGTAGLISSIGSPTAQRFYGRLARYQEEDLSLGGTAGLDLGLSARWNARVGYRYAAPPSRTLHIWSASLTWRF